jgi:primase-polymerase (primpol)-like protein
VLNGDGIVCLDLDDCLSDAGLTPWAASVLASLPATYIELSPSERGLHVWGRGDLPHGRVLSVDGGKVELYGNGRYLTITGSRFGKAPSKLASLPLDALLAIGR